MKARKVVDMWKELARALPTAPTLVWARHGHCAHEVGVTNGQIAIMTFPTTWVVPAEGGAYDGEVLEMTDAAPRWEGSTLIIGERGFEMLNKPPVLANGIMWPMRGGFTAHAAILRDALEKGSDKAELYVGVEGVYLNHENIPALRWWGWVLGAEYAREALLRVLELFAGMVYVAVSGNMTPHLRIHGLIGEIAACAIMMPADQRVPLIGAYRLVHSIENREVVGIGDDFALVRGGDGEPAHGLFTFTDDFQVAIARGHVLPGGREGISRQALETIISCTVNEFGDELSYTTMRTMTDDELLEEIRRLGLSYHMDYDI